MINEEFANPRVEGIRHFRFEEYKEEILSKEEKEYLSAVIRPFRDKIDYIEKVKNGNKEFITIEYEDCAGSISFPDFKRDTMYKGMEIGKLYVLEDLGI